MVKLNKNFMKYFNMFSNLIVLALIIEVAVNWNNYKLIYIIGLMVLIASFRIYQGWEQYDFVTRMGAEQLRTMKRLRKEAKK